MYTEHRKVFATAVGFGSSLSKYRTAGVEAHVHGGNGNRGTESSGVEQSLTPGQQFLKYQVRREIGHGGMGTVFEAWDTDLRRPVALKVLFPRLLANPANANRIAEEARAAAALSHPNIVRIHTLIEHDGLTVIDMEYVEGRPLNALLNTGPLGVPRTVHILVQILSALEACHKRGMAHLDLKPSNILVTAEGHVFLTDFGLARAVAETRPANGETETDWTTPRYAPPEMWFGAPPAMTWDIYSAGVVACECIAGPRAHPSDQQPLKQPDTHLVSLECCSGRSPEFAKLMTSMTARKPKARPADASAALAELRKTPEYTRAQTTATDFEWSTAVGVASESETLQVTPTRKPALRRRVTWLLGACALAALLTAGLYAARPHPVQKSQTTRARPNAAASLPPYSSDPQELTTTGKEVFFTADDGVHGRELWYVRPGSPPRRVADCAKDFTATNPHALFATSDNALYFSAETPDTGPELFRCGNPGEPWMVVSLVRDIVTGPMGSDPQCIANQWPMTLFYATTPQYGRELWSTLGSAQHTAIVKDLFRGPQGSEPYGAPRAAVGPDCVWFIAYVRADTGLHLCQYHFSTNSIRDVAKVSENCAAMAVLGDRLIFAQTDQQHGSELWICYPNNGKPQLLTDIVPGPGSSDPTEFCVLGKRLLFQANTPKTGAELWITDGTAGGTKLLRDIRPGPKGSKPFGFRAGDKFAFFRADDGLHGRELWATDGTPGGTSMVADVNPGPAPSGPYNLAPGERYTAFSANDGVHGEELWLTKFDAGKWQVKLVKDLYPGRKGAEPTDLVWLDHGQYAYFCATLPRIGRELCLLNVSENWPETLITSYDLQPEPGNH